MANTPSNMLALETSAPFFELTDVVSGNMLNINELKGNHATVIFFICNHCPFVLHVNEELVRIARDYGPKGVSFIAISSNDVDNYPQDGPDKMREMALEMKYPFPYLYDETQDVARDYDAACTPDIYAFDRDLKLAYRGQLDGSRPGNSVPVTGTDLSNALDALINGKPVPADQKPSMGCNIKWKSNPSA